MCLMAVAPKKSLIPRDYLQNAFDHNSDGWGIMYATRGVVVALKEKSEMDQFYTAWDAIPDDVRVGVHFRFGTSGPKTSESCHPFPVLQKAKGDPLDLWLMHNGVLRHVDGDKDASDTMRYVERIASQLRMAPGLLKNSDWLEDQEHLLGNPNKIVFLEGNGRWHFLNYKQGVRYESGVWYSNEYSLEPVYCGYGRGKAATSIKDKDKWSHWDDDYNGGYYGTGGYAQGAGYGVKNTAPNRPNTEPNWAIQLDKSESEDGSYYWRKLVFGWTRMRRNPSTGAMWRCYPAQGEKAGCDIATVLPRNNILMFHVSKKDERAWDRGDKFSFEMIAGEHVAIPVKSGQSLTVTKETTPAGAQLSVVTTTTAPEVVAPATFPQSENATSHETSITAALARLDEAEERTRAILQARAVARLKGEPIDGLVICGNSGQPCTMQCEQGHACPGPDREDEEDKEQAYVDQLFSPQSLRDMDEETLIDAVQDYPEAAAIALGAAFNRPWAFEEQEEVA